MAHRSHSQAPRSEESLVCTPEASGRVTFKSQCHRTLMANVLVDGDEGDMEYNLDVNTAFRRAITTWASWVDQHIFPGKTQVFFRSSAPSHFSGGEWNAGGHCRESTRPLNDSHVASVPEMNLIVEEIVKQMRTPVTILNITTLSGFRIDGHPSVYGKKLTNGRPSSVQDCSHWCLPGVPDTWNELLYFNLLSGHRLISTN